MKRFAKIIATIGPACQDETVIEQLLLAGMDVARLNFSHGSHDDHAAAYLRLRNSAARLRRPLTILQDLQGPKIRIGEIPGGEIELTVGQQVRLGKNPDAGEITTIPFDLLEMIACARAGDHFLLDDGNLELKTIAVHPTFLDAEVILGGTLRSNKGINLPGASLDIPGFTRKDEEDLNFGLELGVDAVAVSFVRSAKDVEAVRSAICRLAPQRSSTMIIAKLERPEALLHLDEIISASDGVMVARGDLGIEMPPEEVPIAQKRIIQAANLQARLVITATQMLDSMVKNPRPTRAEASDVANAIFDGSDAVMLSAETAIGKYPVEAVRMMSAIIEQAESHSSEWGRWSGLLPQTSSGDDALYVGQAARELAHDRNVAAIAVFTRTGRTAMLMAKTRPCVPILAFTPQADTFQRLNLFWGVTPYLVSHAETIEAMIHEVERTMVSQHSLRPGEQVVLVCGFPVHLARPANLALLHTIGALDQ